MKVKTEAIIIEAIGYGIFCVLGAIGGYMLGVWLV